MFVEQSCRGLFSQMLSVAESACSCQRHDYHSSDIFSSWNAWCPLRTSKYVRDTFSSRPYVVTPGVRNYSFVLKILGSFAPGILSADALVRAAVKDPASVNFCNISIELQMCTHCRDTGGGN